MKESKKRTAWMLAAGIIAVISIAGCKSDIEPEKPPAPAVPGTATGSGPSNVGGKGNDSRGGNGGLAPRRP